MFFIHFVCIVGSQFRSWLSLESYSWRKVGGRLIIVDSHKSSDNSVEMSDELASTLASIQEFMVGVSRHLDQIESYCQDHHPVGISTYETVPHASQTAQVLPLGTSHGVPFHLSDHCETTPPYDVIMLPPIVTINDDNRLVEQEARVERLEARVERLESRMRQIKSHDEGLTYNDRDDIPAASLPTKFRMPDIESYSGIGCPKIRLRLYSTVMRAHRIDDAQLVALFPMLLSGVGQRWFASVEPSRVRT